MVSSLSGLDKRLLAHEYEAERVGLPDRYLGKVVGLEPAVEQDLSRGEGLFPVRALILLEYEYLAGSRVEVWNEHALTDRGRNQYWVEHIFQAPIGGLKLNGRGFGTCAEAWQYIAQQSLYKNSITVDAVVVTTKPTGAAQWEHVLVHPGDQLMVWSKELYQRKRKVDNQPFINKAGEYMWHSKYIYVQSLDEPGSIEADLN